ncbi:DNA-binding transcriptional regulator, MerR family [Micromonospora echinaurantiaca]|uniref:DNA-binding transcriptional regulator, MerR family n=1 Tax=Micromonospora echinaurantiaca TaxID=47857 RepID=A0A1C5HMG1_9ACTN|nr:MerR family transcriptional regulator [Micromonospora echinaurantiaca]SCG47179.1 DNA-binding transcriptional regulator, MerR family [Micromonospora echinaurantiaca]
MRIGELAARAGVSTRALRYYEEQKLLTAERSASGQRHYPESAVARVQWIQRLYAAGLPSRTVAGLLPCVFSPDSVSAPEMLGKMSAERDRIDAKVADLVATRDKLDTLIEAAREFFTDRSTPAGAGEAVGP